MIRGRAQGKGFTIVELLIVIVVIAILAAITIVSYNGITSRTKIAQVNSFLSSALKAVETSKTMSTSDTLPASLADAKISPASSIQATYSSDQTSKQYCIDAKNSDNYSAYIDSINRTIKTGSCLDFGLAGRWLFNGNANDSSGNNFNGTAYNTTLTTGQNGQVNGAYQFVTGSYVDIGTKKEYVAQVRSMSVWVKRTNFNQHTLLTTKGLSMSANGGKPQVLGYQPTGYFTTDWTHLVMTVNTLTNQAHFYINGVRQSDFDFTSLNTGIDTTSPAGQGYIGTTTSSPFDTPGSYSMEGAIDDLRYYTRELSDADALKLYQMGAQ
jgi:prepilin-type N-terminal cleavage/methylation domain-containing protein